MIIAIHTKPFLDVNENLGFIFSEITTRVGVPFFFVFLDIIIYKNLKMVDHLINIL